MKLRSLTLTLAGLALAAVSSAQFQIAEFVTNPQNADDGYEYFEVRGAANASLAGLTLLVFEGDGAGSGVLDGAISLNAFSVGSTGYFYGRNSLAPAAQTGVNENVYTTVFSSTAGEGFENGTISVLLVSGFTGTKGTDYDTDNNGVFETSPFGAVLDSFAISDTQATTDVVYSSNVFRNGTTNAKLNPASAFTPDAFQRLNGDAYIVGDVITESTTATGLTNFDQTRTAIFSAYRGGHPDSTSREFDFQDFANSGFATSTENPRVSNITPGAVNPVPEPASMAAMALGLGVLAARRRRKSA